jgi:hypothetical protein
VTKPIFHGELQLLRWSETSTGGATVTFQLSDVGDLDGFKDLTLAKKGMAGQRIAAIMAQVEDDVEQAPAPAAPKQRVGELCVMACTFCADEQFQYWAHTQCGECQTEAEAKAFVLETCRITSRKHLDTEPMAAERFHSLIRAPYMAHRNQQ